MAIKVVLVLTVVMYIMLYFMYGNLTWKTIKMNTITNFYYGIPLSFLNGYFFNILDKYYHWETQASLRLFIGVVGSIVLTMITLIILNYVYEVHLANNETYDMWSSASKRTFTIAFFITVIVSSILHAAAFYREVQEQKVINEKLQHEKVKMELNALKAHVDPHFLFNSFNILYGLIEEDPKKAQSLLEQLSGIYRYILENRNEDTNTVNAELEFAAKYLSLHQARFENSIFLETNISEDMKSRCIPALSLQLLLENAIKHNAFNEDAPLYIKISEVDNFIVVSNNKKARKTLAQSSGMGLANIRERYGLLTENTMEVINQNGTFNVKLPVL